MDYEVKYMPMSIVENNIIIAYIVVKCYVIDESYYYDDNKKINKMYKVVPFYDHELIKQEIKYFNDKVLNYTVTNRVFDDVEDAIRYTRVLNTTKLLNTDKHTFEKYYDIEQKLLNDNNTNNIIKFDDIKKRKRV